MFFSHCLWSMPAELDKEIIFLRVCCGTSLPLVRPTTGENKVI